MAAPKGFTYRGIRVVPHPPNTSGQRYETSPLSDIRRLRADTKEGMKELIRYQLSKDKGD